MMRWWHVQIPSLLYLLAMFHTLAGMYWEGENEKAIRRRCHPEISSCFPSQLQWARLKAKMAGKLVWPDDSLNYTIYNHQSNLGTKTYPIVHVVCKTVDDIQNAVTFAKTHNLRVTIKSTGLEFYGLSSAHGSFSINLKEMNEINVNIAATERSEYGEITVQTGATYGEIYAEVEKHDRVVAGENSKSVGPGGSLAGGAYGPLTPSLGLGVDNVLEIKVVLADGRVATCTPNKTVIENNGTKVIHMNGELFWALRGGGGGTFGVVVHYVLKLHPAPTSLVTVFIKFPLYRNTSDNLLWKTLFETHAKWLSTAPFYWGGSLILNPTSPGVYLTKFGPFDENTESELNPFIAFNQTAAEVSIRLSNHSSLASAIYPEPSHYRGFTAGTLIPAEKYNESLWDFLTQKMMQMEYGHCSLARLGGQTWNYGKSWSSVHAGFRRAQSVLTCNFRSPSDHEFETFHAQQRQKLKVAQFAENLRKFGDGNYFNLAYTPSPHWKEDFWGVHYEDLLKVKIKYDPDNLFYCWHCVGSDITSFGGDESEPSRATTNVTGGLSVLLLLVLASIL